MHYKSTLKLNDIRNKVISRHVIAIFFLCTVIGGCTNGPQPPLDQEYTFAIMYDNGTTSEPKIIQAPTDSAAYIDAFHKYCIGVEATCRVEEMVGELNPSMTNIVGHPNSFILIDHTGNDITEITFKNQDVILDSILKMVKETSY